MLNFPAKPIPEKFIFPISLIAVLLLGLAWKLLLLAQDAFPFNADEAVVGLMARHILSGARPVFFYGQAYMGSLDASLVAIAFSILGIKVESIRIVQILIFLGIVFSTMLIAYRVHKNRLAAIISGLLLAIPTVNFTLYTTVSLGGYGEALLIGNILILITLGLLQEGTSLNRYFLWGLAAGLGFWSFGLTLIYIVPCAWVLLEARLRGRIKASKRGVVLCFLGAVIGLSPILVFVLKNGVVELITELLGSAIAGSSPGNFVAATWYHLRNFLIFGPTVILGFRAPWSTEPLSIYLLPLAIVFWLLVTAHAIFRKRSTQGRTALTLFAGSSTMLVLGFLLTPFGADPSGRYFLPLTVPLAILAGEFVRRPVIQIPTGARWLFLLGTIVFQLHATWTVANRLPDRITTQFDPVARVDDRELDSLIRFLSERGLSRGYTNYWVAFPLAFNSDEHLIYYPALPYHHDFRYTQRDNRYPKYEEMVDMSAETSFITTNHDALNQSLRDSFSGLGITWEEAVIGDYRVFFDFSERVDVRQVGSGWLNPGS